MAIVMRVGIVPHLNPSEGGIYQYTLTLLRALHEWKTNDQFVVFTDQTDCPTLSLEADGWQLRPLQPPSAQRKILDGLRSIIGEGRHREAWRWLRGVMGQAKETLPNPDVGRSQPHVSRWLYLCGVELIIYPSRNRLSLQTGLPYVTAIHDLQHRLQPEFPEVSANGEWERREALHRQGIPDATLLVADSEVGKEDILNFYGPFGLSSGRGRGLPVLTA